MGTFQYRSFNFPDHFIRHRGFRGLLTKMPVGGAADFTFELIETGDGLVRFRSANFPDRYLRHRNSEIWVDRPNGSSDRQFRRDSTYFLDPGLADIRAISLRSVNFPNRYLRHRDFQLWLEEPGSGGPFPADATFYRSVLID